MAFFDDLQNVLRYEKTAEGFDGRELVERLVARLDPETAVLELGMGPGRDLDLLLEAGVSATGSDAAQPFLDRYGERGGEAETLLLDARTLETDRPFGAIYSNKVLQHLTPDELRASLRRQAELVGVGGLLFHTFWRGADEETHHGMLFCRYEEDALAELLPPGLRIEEAGRYCEIWEEDSLWVLFLVGVAAP